MVAPESINTARIADASLFNAQFDALAVGGASILAYILFLFANLDGKNPALLQVALFAAYVCNYPHYAATYYRAYSGSSEIRTYALTTILAPLALTAVAAFAFYDRNILAPIFFMAYLITNGYHYAGQSYGIALVYAGKAKVQLSKLQKQIIALPLYLSWIYLVACGQVIGGLFGIDLTALTMPLSVRAALSIAVMASILLYLGMNVQLYVNRKEQLPVPSHLAVIAQLVWFLGGPSNPAYFLFVPFFHCLQYLVITSYFDSKTVGARHPDSVRTTSQYLGSRYFIRYYGLQMAVGALLFWGLPELFIRVTNTSGNSALFVNALVFTFLNLHHFVLDGAIWKLRKPAVRAKLVEA